MYFAPIEQRSGPNPLLEKCYGHDPYSTEGYLAPHAGERRAETEVNAQAEGEMPAVAPGDVETVGVCERLRVAVRRADQDHRLPALLDRDAVELDVFHP